MKINSLYYEKSCKIKIQPPKEKIRYDILDAHLHFTDFLEQTDVWMN